MGLQTFMFRKHGQRPWHNNLTSLMMLTATVDKSFIVIFKQRKAVGSNRSSNDITSLPGQEAQ